MPNMYSKAITMLALPEEHSEDKLYVCNYCMMTAYTIAGISHDPGCTPVGTLPNPGCHGHNEDEYEDVEGVLMCNWCACVATECPFYNGEEL